VEEVFENMPEEEFLGELSEKTTSVTIKEFTPDGVLISYNLQGTQKGQYDATHMETVDALFKPDGTYEFEARGIDQTDDGDHHRIDRSHEQIHRSLVLSGGGAA